MPVTAKEQNKTKGKKKKNIPFSLVHLFSIWGHFKDSRGAEAPRALPIGAIILHLSEFSNVWRVVVISPVFSLAEFKALLLVVLLAFRVRGGL